MSPVTRRASEALLLAGVIAAALVLGGREIRTPDALFHIALGRDILARHAVPRGNEWLAFERGRPFADGEWGFQVALALAHSRGGLLGVLVLREALVIAAGLAVFVAARAGGSALGAGLAAAGFLATAESRFLDAPEMVSIALAALFVLILEARERRPRLPWALPPLLVLWANVHGFFALGIALLAIYALGDLVHRRTRLLPVLAAAAAAPALNPYGLEGLLYPLRVAGDVAGRALLSERIVELRSPLTDVAISASLPARAFQVVAGLALGALLLGTIAGTLSRLGWRLHTRPALTLERAIAIAIAIAIAVPHVRNVGLMGAIAAPLTALIVSPLLLRFEAERRRAALALVAALAATLGLSGGAVLGGALERSSLEPVGVGPALAPPVDHRRAIEFYLGSGLPEAVWNEFGTGHALIEASRGRIRPAICPMTDLYPPEMLKAYGDALARPDGLAALLARWPANALFLDHRRLEGSALLASAIADWTLVYLDARDAIFLRRGTRAALDLDSVDLESHLCDPVRDRLALASFLLAAGKLERAETLAREALALRTDWAPAHYILGAIVRERGDLDEAKSHFARAVELVPDAADAHEKLGLVHMRLMELGRAEEEMRAAAALDPGAAYYRENLRALLVSLGRADDAIALPLPAEEPWDPAFADAWLNLGNLLHRAGRYADAAAWYRRASTAAPKDVEARYDLGIALRDAGRLDEAAAALREALALDPGHARAQAALREMGR